VGFWAVLGVGLAVALANMTKPVHVDDTLYLSIARWIVEHPLDPYGGPINWQQFPQPAYEVSISPPLVSYLYAAVIALAGENIALLHLTMIPWVLLTGWALYGLGRRWCGEGTAAALLVMLGPAVAAGMNLMLDVPLLACMAAAVECLCRGLERSPGAARWYAGAGLLGAAGVLIKFPALALVPVFLFAALRRRRLGPLVAVAGPLGALVAWQVASRMLYGAGQVQAGLSFLGQFRTSFARQVLERTLTMFAILAWTFPVWVLAPARLSRRGWIVAGLGAGLAVAAALALAPPAHSARFGLGPLFLAGVGLGAFSVAAAVLPAAGREATPAAGDGIDRPLLWVWILGVAAIVIPFGPFVAVRSFLPLQPPLALLLLSGRRLSRAWLAGAIGVTAVPGALLAVADHHWAASYPAAAQRLAAELGPSGRPILFLGHWGWQYYAERAGFHAWDARWRDAPAGAIVIVPLRADRQWLDPRVGVRLRLRERITFGPAPLDLTTWNRSVGVRFYGGDYGEIPWGLSSQPAEEFFVSEVGPLVPALPSPPRW
jgi:4-amino-4-deoxy-L-arabinose transferase-like glycosyltransferase